MDPEMRDMLLRHGLTPADVVAVERFEAQIKADREARKSAPVVEPEPLDLGDWTG